MTDVHTWTSSGFEEYFPDPCMGFKKSLFLGNVGKGKAGTCLREVKEEEAGQQPWSREGGNQRNKG